MLPLPRHLLKIDPQDVLHEIEDDSLSQFVWSFRANLVNTVRRLMARPQQPGSNISAVSECCTL